MRHDERWIRQGVGLLEMSAGALAVAPAPTRRGVLAFAALAGGLGERAPAWLAPWPTVEVALAADDDVPLGAVVLERCGPGVRLSERPPGTDGVEPRVVLEYYLHLVHDHCRARRLAARQPAGGATRLPADEARLAEAFEEVALVLAGAAGRERLTGLWEALDAS